MYVGGLQWWTTDAELDALCRPYGELISLRFFEDKGNGKSKGYALANFATAEAALRCKEGLNGSATHRIMLGLGQAHKWLSLLCGAGTTSTGRSAL